MRSAAMVMRDPLTTDAPQVAGIEWNDKVQTLATYGRDQSFAMSISCGHANGGFQHVDAQLSPSSSKWAEIVLWLSCGRNWSSQSPGGVSRNCWSVHSAVVRLHCIGRRSGSDLERDKHVKNTEDGYYRHKKVAGYYPRHDYAETYTIGGP